MGLPGIGSKGEKGDSGILSNISSSLGPKVSIVPIVPSIFFVYV